jgi:hypothetical protein
MPHDLGVQPTPVDDAPRVHRGVDRGEQAGGLLLVALGCVAPVGYLVVDPDERHLALRIAFALMQILTLLVMALVAPLVGWRRRDMWWSVVPIWVFVIAYRLGVGLVRRARGEDVSGRFPRL